MIHSDAAAADELPPGDFRLPAIDVTRTTFGSSPPDWTNPTGRSGVWYAPAGGKRMQSLIVYLMLGFFILAMAGALSAIAFGRETAQDPNKPVPVVLIVGAALMFGSLIAAIAAPKWLTHRAVNRRNESLLRVPQPIKGVVVSVEDAPRTTSRSSSPRIRHCF
ncbi:MAG: hypothetical protein QM770_00850 [Tepidisphaeraceae bacterium]